MEQPDFTPEELEMLETPEREPEPDDVAIAFRQVMHELAPDVDPPGRRNRHKRDRRRG